MMHTTHANDAERTNSRASLKANNFSPRHIVSNTGTPTNGAQRHREQSNGGINGSGNVSDNCTTATNGIGNTNGTTNNFQNGTRRDSTQLWTPLLPNGNGNSSGSGGSPETDNEVDMDSVNCVVDSERTDPTTVLYDDTPTTNNNEWKDAEEINNLKNGLLHQPHTHTPHQRLHQGNNNGSLLNGKNGLGLPDKYDEQDPLTGLYKQKNARPSESEESDFDSDLSGDGTGERKPPTCGILGCRPKWARRFASTHAFMVVFLFAYILQGMYMTYFVSVITTIEKLFQIKSKTTGFLLSASEMGQISTAMLLTYFAGRGHRPRWIACGMVLFSIAAFSCALPHFIFGKQLMQSKAVMNSLSVQHNRLDEMLSAGGQQLRSSYGLYDGNHTNMWQDNMSLNATVSSLSMHDMSLCIAGGNKSSANSECNDTHKQEQESHSKITVIVLCIFFASLLSSGMGQTAVATLGIPYIDDNVASKQSPMYMAITIGVRILGPASGFIIGSFCTRWYVNFSNPGFDASDPRWIGAWWLGPVAIGTLMMLASLAMFSFPKQLRGKRKPPVNAVKDAADATTTEPEEKPKLKDFPKTVRRQLSNDILMFRTASCVFHLLPIAGLYTFLPKYLETQFRLASYDANMITAFCGILVMGVGIVISGLVILKLKPSAKSVAAWIALTALVYAAGMVILMFVGCNMDDFAGYKPSSSNGPADIGPACDASINCTCPNNLFAPICGLDKKIYKSPCEAGCTASELRSSDNRTIYFNCACIPESGSESLTKYEAVSGYCDSECKNFILFIVIFALCVFMHSTSEVGSMLLVMRCTHPKDKAMAMGVIQSAIGLFGNVPCPIIYGAVVDSACLIWKTVCDKDGACSLYDSNTFRHYFLGITAGIMFLAFIMDVVVWSKAHRIDIAPEDGHEHHDDENKSTETAECKKSMATPDTSV